jgi:hypothetical protein
MNNRIFLLCILPLLLTSFTLKERPPLTEYLSLSGPISFNETSYHLSWTAHPSDSYYKQEYLPSGQQASSFTKMLIIEALTGDVSLPAIVKAKVNELEERKKTDRMANYQLNRNPANGEYLLDFMMSVESAGKPTIVEWNVYRYGSLSAGNGSSGIRLFACSQRAYGDQIAPFLKNLKTTRPAIIAAMGKYTLPPIKIKPAKS